MRAYAERVRRGRGALRGHRAAPRPRLRAPSRHGQRHRPPAHGARAVPRARLPGRADRRGGRATPTSSSVPRESRMAKTLYAVDELSGFVAACALVRPTGIVGLTPKSVKKKLKQPSFAAGREPRRRPARRRGAGRGLRRARGLRDRRDGAEAEELGLARERPARLRRARSASARRPWPSRPGARPSRRSPRSGAPPRWRTSVSVTSPSGSPQWAQASAWARPGSSSRRGRTRLPVRLPGSTRAPRARAGRTPRGARRAARGGASRPRGPPRDRTRNSVSVSRHGSDSARDGRTTADYRPRGRRDRPGAARAGAARARPGGHAGSTWRSSTTTSRSRTAGARTTRW